MVERMKRGERKRFLVGVGHGGCTCEGAAFEYVVNLEFELRAHGVRDKAEIIFVTNEYELGDFGVDGMHIRRGGYVTPGKIFAESLFAERGIQSITKAHVRAVEPQVAHIETLDAGLFDVPFDMAMLLPPFTGVGLKAFSREGEDITGTVFAPSGFMKVDADYTKKAYADWKAARLAAPLSEPRLSEPVRRRHCLCAAASDLAAARTAAGQVISPAPPRTGMPSAMIGKAVAHSIVDMLGGSPRADARRVHGGDGRGLRCLRRRQPVHRHGGVDHGISDRAGLRAIPGIRARHRLHVRRDRPRRALDQDPAAPHVPVQGPFAAGLVPDPGVVMSEPTQPGRRPATHPDDAWSSATKPTRSTLFWRTFLPWQAWRFVWINVKMIEIILRGHRGR